MKSKLFILFILSATISLAQNTKKTSKNCYEEYYQAFMERGALPVPDGEQNVVISLRTDTGCHCIMGKVTVTGGKIVPSVLIKKTDGTYEPAKRQLHVNMDQGHITSQGQYDIYKGMSATFLTEYHEIADMFFIDYLKRKVVANAEAPSPNDIAGVQVQLQGAEKEAVQKAYDGLQFDFGKASIQPSSFQYLNLLASMLVEHPEYKLTLKGYTDNVGKAEDNLELSKNRAKAVREYLVKQGLDESRISSEGYGMESPIADNATDEGRAKNRRVEFIVSK